jgi:hypothetical protein
MDRFGSQATQALVSEGLNGLESVDEVLQDLEIMEPETGLPITADSFFLDWVVTNYLKDEYNVDDRFKYHSYPQAPILEPTEVIDGCSSVRLQRDVHQYGADYIQINCREDFTLNFGGQESVQVIPQYPYSGDFAFWSNKGDQSDMKLTREFDFRGVDGPIILHYWTWFDLEEKYDYVFLEVSTNGEDWKIIRTPSSTNDNPSGNSYGWGYNGISGGNGSWIKEEVDLSNYAGEVIQLRFEYITDDAVNGEGLLIDKLSIPAIDYFTDFEDDNGGWIPEGFVRIQIDLPQTYQLAIMYLGDVPRVEYQQVMNGNQISLPIKAGTFQSNGIILVVTGTTRYTRQLAEYWIELADQK